MKIHKNVYYRMSRLTKPADYFTLGNFVSGLFSIIFAIKGEFFTSAMLMLLAVVMDFLDGRVARATGSSNEFGKQLDSLSDALSFGVAPAVFGYCLGLESYYALIILAYFASCGILRLARYNIAAQKVFIGVPITVNGVLFPLIYIIFGGFNNYVLIIYLLMGLLMISTLRIKKF